jgi:hypothetical protein
MIVYGNRASHKLYYVLVSDSQLFRTENPTPGGRGFEPVINGKKILLLFFRRSKWKEKDRQLW